MKSMVHNKGDRGSGSASEKCRQLQRSYDCTWGLEIQSCLIRPEFWTRLEKNLSRVDDPWSDIEY